MGPINYKQIPITNGDSFDGLICCHGYVITKRNNQTSKMEEEMPLGVMATPATTARLLARGSALILMLLS